jgi:hypothetical protein
MALMAGNCADKDATVTFPILNTNAVELTWTLPASYDVPDDGTSATMTCKTTITASRTFTMW